MDRKPEFQSFHPRVGVVIKRQGNPLCQPTIVILTVQSNRLRWDFLGGLDLNLSRLRFTCSSFYLLLLPQPARLPDRLLPILLSLPGRSLHYIV